MIARSRAQLTEWQPIPFVIYTWGASRFLRKGTMDHAIDRPVYQPSGRCDGARFPAALALLVAGALGIVAIYCFLIYIEVYPSGLSVVFPAALAGGCARLLGKIEAICARDFVGQPTVPPDPSGIPT
jgi:hypothetical protein